MTSRLLRPFGRPIREIIDRRTKTTAPPLIVDRRHVYILPTANGWLFALMLVIMLLGATHYSNNLAFALTFWLAAIAVVSMHRAHRNLLHLSLESVHSEPVFAGGAAYFVFVFANNARRTRRALRVNWAYAEPQTIASPIDGGVTRKITLACPTVARGTLACPAIEISSLFPMGLCRVWTRLRPDAGALVYPARAGRAAFPLDHGSDDVAGRADERSGETEFVTHRQFVSGDPPRRIDWKASARRDRLLVRENADPATPALCFSFEKLAGTAVESKLSQLALWVDAAETLGARYELRLPHTDYELDHGPGHRRRCLTALAHF